MVCEYNSIRSRLYNSQALLEGTNLMLYNINKGVLVILRCNKYVWVHIYLLQQMRWYKNTVRREITMLMQGLVLPNPRPCAASPLPPVMEWLTSPPPLPVEPFEFHKPVDTYGQARVQRRGNILASSIPPPPPPPGSTATPMLHDIPVLATTAATTCTETISVTPVLVTTPMPSVTLPLPVTTTTTTDVTTVPLPATEVTVVFVSRTTEWHCKKGVGVLKTPRKGYACKIRERHKSSKYFQNKLHRA